MKQIVNTNEALSVLYNNCTDELLTQSQFYAWLKLGEETHHGTTHESSRVRFQAWNHVDYVAVIATVHLYAGVEWVAGRRRERGGYTGDSTRGCIIPAREMRTAIADLIDPMRGRFCTTWCGSNLTSIDTYPGERDWKMMYFIPLTAEQAAFVESEYDRLKYPQGRFRED